MILLIKVHKIQQNSSIGDCPEKYVHSNEIMEQKIESKAQNKTCDATEHKHEVIAHNVCHIVYRGCNLWTNDHPDSELPFGCKFPILLSVPYLP